MVARRLDLVLVARGLVASRARAQAMIAAGKVRVEGKTIDRASREIDEQATIELAEADSPWVSRAALKLLHGLDRFGFDPAGRIVLDIGASTGGFSQVLLSRGAARVYAVDVGTGQIDARLRADPRLISIEKTNARSLSREIVPEPVAAIVCDASFIGLEIILPASLALAAPGAFLVALIKPQFEVGPGQVGKGGIVRDPSLHRDVCARIEAWLGRQTGWRILGVAESPITGGDGNREFLIAAMYQP